MAENKGYKTRQRELIAEFLGKNSDRHFTADEVFEYLRESGSPVGLTTIYRALDKLENDGKLRKFTSQGSSACFQVIGEGCYCHYHLKCSQCGELVHLECNFLDELSRHIADDYDFTIDSGKTVLLGVCGKCRCDLNR